MKRFRLEFDQLMAECQASNECWLDVAVGIGGFLGGFNFDLDQSLSSGTRTVEMKLILGVKRCVDQSSDVETRRYWHQGLASATDKLQPRWHEE